MYVTTFHGPFVATGNGYFAAWMGLYGAMVHVSATLPKLKESVPQGLSRGLLGLGTSAFVVCLALTAKPSACALRGRGYVYGCA